MVPDLLALNKQAAHRAMEGDGHPHAGMRATAEIKRSASTSCHRGEYMASFATRGVSAALSEAGPPLVTAPATSRAASSGSS